MRRQAMRRNSDKRRRSHRNRAQLRTEWGKSSYRHMSREVRYLLISEALIELFGDMPRGISFWDAVCKLELEEGCEVCEMLTTALKTELPPGIWALDITEVVARVKRYLSKRPE